MLSKVGLDNTGGMTMSKAYSIFYRGKLAEKSLTRRGAQARAFELAQEKGWNVYDIIILNGNADEQTPSHD
jgi:hypothetical protein